MSPTLETLRCSAGHDWLRPRMRGRKPSACPAHGGTSSAGPNASRVAAGQVYRAALSIALDRGADPAERRRANTLMRELAAEMRNPLEDQVRDRNSARNTDLRDLVGQAIDERVFGPVHHVEA